ncbi:MAG: AzlD domain-containing protein [Actinomycetota bacterium]|nr:AzlD domain-containing protein [Actinomycetota bacterium]
MTLGLVVTLAVLTYASRAAALVLLPPPGPRLAALLDRMPAPLFAGLAAVLLIEDGPALAPVTTIAALVGALLVAWTRSMPIILAGGLGAAVIATLLT